MRTGLSRQSNASPHVGIKFAGKGFARARDRAEFLPRDRPSAAAETGDLAPTRASVEPTRGVSRRPQETAFEQDCVVADAFHRNRSPNPNSLITGNLTG